MPKEIQPRTLLGLQIYSRYEQLQSSRQVYANKANYLSMSKWYFPAQVSNETQNENAAVQACV